VLSIAASTPIYLFIQPADMRKSFDGLSGLVTDAFGHDVFATPGSEGTSSAGAFSGGGLFVFHNKRKDRLKILYFDHDGFALWYKRLEQGTFVFPVVKPGQTRLTVSPTDLRLILDGVDLKSVKKLKRYTPSVKHDHEAD